MAKAILEFNLEEPEDRDAHMRAVKSLSMAIALWEMDQYLRAECKYGELSDDAYTTTEKAREKLREILNENNLTFDELIH